MDFDPRDMSVNTMFKTFETFRIPVFQRDYSWDKPYYSKFLEDIISRIKKTTLEPTPYFIGTMVIKGKEYGGIVDVVDGQQRITTITILFSALSRLFANIKETDLSDAMFKYIKEKNNNGELTKKLITDRSFPYFECSIQSKENKYDKNPISEEEKNIKETYDYIIKTLSEQEIKKRFNNEVKYEDILKAIRDQILKSHLICIRTTDIKSAHMIFEILNAKGKSLASIDLIKNAIFEILHNDPNSASDKAESLWNETKLKLRGREISVGFSTFYRQFWMSKYNKVTNIKLYDEFKKQIQPETVENYINFLEDLNKEADLYIKIIKPELSDFNNRKEYACIVQSLKSISQTFGNIQSRVALLALLDAKQREVISFKVLNESLKSIENFIFSYIVIASQPANIFEPLFSKFAVKLRASKTKDDSNNIIEKYLYSEFEKKFIDYELFEKNFIDLQYQKKGNEKEKYNYTKYAINKIACAYNEEEIFDRKSSVEHILPEKNDISFNIGNLICIEGNLNNEAQNFLFEEKKEIYIKSKYKQVNDFISEYTTFNESFIRDRAKKLSKYYYNEILIQKNEKMTDEEAISKLSQKLLKELSDTSSRVKQILLVILIIEELYKLHPEYIYPDMYTIPEENFDQKEYIIDNEFDNIYKRSVDYVSKILNIEDSTVKNTLTRQINMKKYNIQTLIKYYIHKKDARFRINHTLDKPNSHNLKEYLEKEAPARGYILADKAAINKYLRYFDQSN